MKTSNMVFKVFVLLLSISVITAYDSYAADNHRKLATATNDFGLNLYRTVALRKTENVLFSPISIAQLLAMLLFGAGGETARELHRMLGYNKVGLSDEDVPRTFQSLLGDVYTKNISRGYLLDTANFILVDKQHKVLPSYQNRAEHFYKAIVENVNFENQHRLMEKMNTWVTRATHGKIKTVLDSVTQDAAMILLNAMYFHGLWESPFDPKQTTERYFYNYGKKSNRRKVPTMRRNDANYLYMGHDYQALLLPYKHNETDMLIILPRSKLGLPNLVKSMDLETIHKIRKKMYKVPVKVRLPKFSFKYTQNMREPFINMGMSGFMNQMLDLSKMTNAPNLGVSEFLHKTTIDVTEEGTEAAAVSAVAIETRTAPMYFRANKPFMFAIMDKRTELILFLGQVTNL